MTAKKYVRNMDGRYRLNCHITTELGSRLCDYCERTGMSKVNVVMVALDNYFTQEQVRFELTEKMKDPLILAEVTKRLGIAIPGAKE